MRRTLVVVDVQPYYVDDGAPYMDRIVKLILQFKEYGNPIILLEYGFDQAGTVKVVKDAVGAYRHCVTVRKDGLCGGREVIEECEGHQWPLDFLLCGVAYNCCVQETADTLAEQYLVEVALDCTDAGSDGWRGGPRVIVTRQFEEAA